MIKTTVICGGSAVREYDEYGEVPSREWLDEHGGVVEEKEFRTQEEYNAYSMGLADAAEWDDTMLLRPVFSENAATDCPHCKEWRAFFSDRKSDVYCPDCGKLILHHPTDDKSNGTIIYEEKEYPVRTLSNGETIATIELGNLLIKDDEFVSEEARLIDIGILYYADRQEFNLPEKELLSLIYK